MPSCAVKKLQRGHYKYRISDDGILITRWNDNSTVTVASTLHTVYPVGVVKTEKKQTTIPRPQITGEHNKFMSRTDLVDQKKHIQCRGSRQKNGGGQF